MPYEELEQIRNGLRAEYASYRQQVEDLVKDPLYSQDAKQQKINELRYGLREKRTQAIKRLEASRKSVRRDLLRETFAPRTNDQAARAAFSQSVMNVQKLATERGPEGLRQLLRIADASGDELTIQAVGHAAFDGDHRSALVDWAEVAGDRAESLNRLREFDFEEGDRRTRQATVDERMALSMPSPTKVEGATVTPSDSANLSPSSGGSTTASGGE